MDNKHKKVLQSVIFEYIETSKPVSSKQLTAKCGCSASSIRNWMSKLSRNGYLKSLHTSSGKVPTDKGWRFYIDELLDAQRAIKNEKEELRQAYLGQVEKANAVLVELAKTFFYTLEHSDYNIAPRKEKTVFSEIILKAINKQTVLGTIFSANGAVKFFSLKTDVPVRQEFLDGASALLNNMLSGVSLSKIKTIFDEKKGTFESQQKTKLDFIKDNIGTIFDFESAQDQTATKIDADIKRDIYEFPTIWEKGSEDEREKK